MMPCLLHHFSVSGPVVFRIENDQLANLVFKKNVITTFYVRSNSALLSYLGVSGAVCLRDVHQTKQ